MSTRLKKSLSAILLALLALEVNATQVIEGADRAHVQVNISAADQNRLVIDGRRIANVVAPAKGIITYQKDEALGALYFALASDAQHHGTVTLFVSDDKGITYKLILVPRPVAGEEIVLRPPAEKAAALSRSTPDGRTVSYQRHIKNLVLLMADSSSQSGVEAVDENREVPLWKEGKLVLSTKYIDGDMVGEKYRLTNVSPSDLLVVEQELYRSGVRAVAVEHHTLPPGESTNIFIVRERKENE